MTGYLESALVICGPGLVAAALVLALASVPSFAGPHRWAVLSVASSLAAGLAAFGVAATDIITANSLLRDALACGALSASIASIASVSVAMARWRQASAARYALLGMLPIFLVVGVSPLVVLIVHCSSGDCL